MIVYFRILASVNVWELEGIVHILFSILFFGGGGHELIALDCRMAFHVLSKAAVHSTILGDSIAEILSRLPSCNEGTWFVAFFVHSPA